MTVFKQKDVLLQNSEDCSVLELYWSFDETLIYLIDSNWESAIHILLGTKLVLLS